MVLSLPISFHHDVNISNSIPFWLSNVVIHFDCCCRERHSWLMFALLCLLSPHCAVSMWTMAHHQVAAPWTPWPARAQASSCRLILSTVSGESRSCTAPTATTTSRPSLCPETPPLPVTCECTVFCFFYLPLNLHKRQSTKVLSVMIWFCLLFFQSPMFNFRFATQLWPWWEECMPSGWLYCGHIYF